MAKKQDMVIIEEPVKQKKPNKREKAQDLSMELGDLADDLLEQNTLDKEQALAESIRLLGRTENIDTLTELEDKEIIALSILKAMDNEFNIPILTDFSNDFVKFRVSKKRKGRKGIEDILRSTLNERDNLFGNIKDRFNNFGR